MFRFGSAHRHEFSLLDKAQQLALNFQVYVADFIQENRPLVRGFEYAFFVCDRSGECALDVAEQLAFQEFNG